MRIVGTVQPDRLVEALAGAEVGMAARFLHVWPDTPLYRSILDRRVVDDESALARLKRISGEGGEVDTPRKLPVSGLITRGKRPSLAHTLGLSHHEILPSEVAGWVRGFEPPNQSANQCVLASITENGIVAIYPRSCRSPRL